MPKNSKASWGGKRPGAGRPCKAKEELTTSRRKNVYLSEEAAEAATLIAQGEFSALVSTLLVNHMQHKRSVYDIMPTAGHESGVRIVLGDGTQVTINDVFIQAQENGVDSLEMLNALEGTQGKRIGRQAHTSRPKRVQLRAMITECYILP